VGCGDTVRDRAHGLEECLVALDGDAHATSLATISSSAASMDAMLAKTLRFRR